MAHLADDDDPTAPLADHSDADVDDGPNLGLFASMFDKHGVMGRRPRRGDKDFESHGTRAQDRALEASQTVLEDMLRYTRVHPRASWLRGWYYPDWWAPGGRGEDTLGAGRRGGGDDGDDQSAMRRERVVVVETQKGAWTRSMGRAVPGVRTLEPGCGRIWLLPEEALYLVERGTLDLWWPACPLEQALAISPPGKIPAPADEDADGAGEKEDHADNDDEGDLYKLGLPLTLRAAYSLLIGRDGEPGKVSLPKYQVFTHLKRMGYHVLRGSGGGGSSINQLQPQLHPPRAIVPATITSLLQWLLALVAPQRGDGPLVRPGLYTSYSPIFNQLVLIARHSPRLTTPTTIPRTAQVGAETGTETSPFRVAFHVWAPTGQPFTKTRPGAPDFRFAVLDARETCTPTLDEIASLIESTPPLSPLPVTGGVGGTGGTRGLYRRLKHGQRAVGVAVVDCGIVNFLRFADTGFADERLWERFDERARKGASGGGKSRGGGGGGGGRGGGRGGSGGMRKAGRGACGGRNSIRGKP